MTERLRLLCRLEADGEMPIFMAGKLTEDDSGISALRSTCEPFTPLRI